MSQLFACLKCGQMKPAENFHRNLQRPSGLDRHCKACYAIVRKGCKRRKPRETSGEKFIARKIFRQAMVRGDLVREPCFMCGAEAEAHHPAYSSPLLVTWLCKAHHRQIHAEHSAKRVLAVNPQTGETHVLPNIAAWNDRGFVAKSIANVCRGHKHSHRGLVFKYADAGAAASTTRGEKP